METQAKKHILLVDDEANILASLKREFLANRRGEFEVETYTSPLEALVTARERQFDVVISDYKMPEMDGLTFLNAFQAIQPDTTRMILSGQADLHALADAINQTRIYRFIAKPWNGVELAAAVAQALAYRRLSREYRRLAAIWEEKWGTPEAHYDPTLHHQILVVDDEPNVLNAVSRDLSRPSRFQGVHAAMRREGSSSGNEAGELRFIVEAIDTPQGALEQAARVEYDVVIADYRMPGMDGVRFLEAFREIQPDAARILFSGQADMQALIGAINRSEIYAFVAKPWNEFDLRATVAQAIAFRNLLRENRRLADRLGENDDAE